MSVSFLPEERRIVLNPGVTQIDARFIYSRWKEWTISNPQYLPAFRVLGGDPIGSGLSVASYFFLVNDWRIRPFEGNHSLTIEGNLIVEGGGIPVVNTLGNFNVSVQYTVPVQAQGIETGSAAGLTPSQELALMQILRLTKANLALSA